MDKTQPLYITAKDIEIGLGCSKSTAYRRLQDARVFYDLKKYQLLTPDRFCTFIFGYICEEFMDRISIKKPNSHKER